MIECHPDNPFRPPNWPWKSAAWLRESGRHFSRRRDGPAVGRAKRFRDRLIRCKSDRHFAKLAHDQPDMYAAWELSSDTTLMRPVIEGRILAKQPFDEIAAGFGCSVGMIEAYESVFFRVLERIDKPFYIVHQVLRINELGAFDDFGTCCRFFGFTGGAIALDCLIGVYAEAHPADVSEIGPYFHANAKTTLAVKAALAISCARITQEHALDWLDLFFRWRELRVRELEHGPLELEERLNEMLDMLRPIIEPQFASGEHWMSPLFDFDKPREGANNDANDKQYATQQA